MSGIHPAADHYQPQPQQHHHQQGPAVVSVDKLWNLGFTVALVVAILVIGYLAFNAYKRFIQQWWAEKTGGRRARAVPDEDDGDEEAIEEEEEEPVPVKRKKVVPVRRVAKKY